MEERNELCQALAQAEAVCGMESLLGLVFFWERVGSSSCKNKENTEDYQTCFKLRHKVADGALEPDWAQTERPSGEVEDQYFCSASAAYLQAAWSNLLQVRLPIYGPGPSQRPWVDLVSSLRGTFIKVNSEEM